MNALRELSQARATQVMPPAPLCLPLHEMSARLLRPDRPLRQLMLVGASPQVGTTFVANHWSTLLAAHASVLVVECRADAPEPPAEEPLARGRVSRLRLSEPDCLALLRGGTSQDLQHAFDMVLWDVQPVATSPAALLLARHVDGIVLLIQPRRTRRQVALDAVIRLRESGGNVLGVVINRSVDSVPGWLNRLI